MKKIACIGNLAYDIVGYTKSYPYENSRTNYEKLTEGAGGPSSNAAGAIKRLGGEVDFYGKVGDDIYGKNLVYILNKENINIEHLEIKNNFHTPFSFVIISYEDKTRTINTYREPSDFTNPTILPSKKFETGYDSILTDGKYPGDVLKLISLNPRAITIIDAGRSSKSIINLAKHFDYVICSEDYANGLMDYLNCNIKLDFTNMDTIDFVMYKMKEFYPKNNIAITVGKEGCLYFDKNNNIIHMPAYEVDEVKDTNAAGDIFHGAFTYAITNDYSYEDSLYFANVTASLSTTKEGGRNSCPSIEEIDNAIKQRKVLIK